MDGEYIIKHGLYRAITGYKDGYPTEFLVKSGMLPTFEEFEKAEFPEDPEAR